MRDRHPLRNINIDKNMVGYLKTYTSKDLRK